MFRISLTTWVVRFLVVGATVAPAWSNGSARAAASASATADPALPTDRLTLDRALELVRERHPSVAAAEARVRAAEAEREQAGAWANPRLGLDAEGFGGDDQSGLEPDEFALSLGWPLHPLLTRGRRASVAEARTALARAALERTEWELLAATRSAYHRALVADEQVDFAERRLDLTARTVGAFTAQVDAGEASPIQLLRAEVESETARSGLEAARAQRRIAHRELAALWVESLDEPLHLAGRSGDHVALSGVDSLEHELIERHPLLRESRWQREIESRGEQLAARARWPEFTPRAGIRWLPDTDDQDFVAGIGIELPLFDRRDAARRAAARRTEAADGDLAALQLELRTQLYNALEELHVRAGALEDYDERIVPRAQDALDRVRIGQEAGKFGALELLDAQRALVAAEQGRFRAHATYDRVVVQIESLLGRRITAPAPHSPAEDPR